MAGVGIMVAPVSISEITPEALRGSMASFPEMSLFGGEGVTTSQRLASAADLGCLPHGRTADVAPLRKNRTSSYQYSYKTNVREIAIQRLELLRRPK
jgi:hypothetical protein